MTKAIVPEVVGLETQILENSPMTDAEEKELVIITTAITTAYADKSERDPATGEERQVRRGGYLDCSDASNRTGQKAVEAKDGNLFGYSDVYLEGDRVFGRTQ